MCKVEQDYGTAVSQLSPAPWDGLPACPSTVPWLRVDTPGARRLQTGVAAMLQPLIPWRPPLQHFESFIT